MRAIEAHFHPSLSFFCHIMLQYSKEVLLCRNNSEIFVLLFSLHLLCHFIVLLQLASDAFPKDMTLALAYLLALPQVSLTALFADLSLSFSHFEWLCVCLRLWFFITISFTAAKIVWYWKIKPFKSHCKSNTKSNSYSISLCPVTSGPPFESIIAFSWFRLVIGSCSNKIIWKKKIFMGLKLIACLQWFLCSLSGEVLLKLMWC